MCGVPCDWTGHLKYVDNHIPLATVTAQVRGVGQEINQPVIKRLFSILDGEFKIIVGLVQLIPEEQVGL